MRNEKLTAIIPVREGSQRVKNKNIKPFAGSTLLDIKIEILKREESSKPADLFSEIRFGAFLHDTGPFSASDEEGVDVNLEILL